MKLFLIALAVLVSQAGFASEAECKNAVLNYITQNRIRDNSINALSTKIFYSHETEAQKIKDIAIAELSDLSFVTAQAEAEFQVHFHCFRQTN